MTMEHRRDAVSLEQGVDRPGPSGPMFAEPVAAVGIAATPFHERSNGRSAAHLPVPAPDQMVDEDQFERSRTGLQHRGQPAVLLLAQGHRPGIVPPARGGEPEGVQHHEQGAPPLPGVIVLQRTGVGPGGAIAGVDPARLRIREVLLAHPQRPQRHGIRMPIEPLGLLAIVVSQHHQHRHLTGDGPEEVALGDVLGFGAGVESAKLVDHGGVAEVDEEIRRVGPDVDQCLLVEPYIGSGVEVAVGLEGHREAGVLGASGMERSPEQARIAGGPASSGDRVGIGMIRLKSGHGDHPRLAGLQPQPFRVTETRPPRQAPGDPEFQGFLRKEIQRHVLGTGSAQPRSQRHLRNFGRDHRSLATARRSVGGFCSQQRCAAVKQAQQQAHGKAMERGHG